MTITRRKFLKGLAGCLAAAQAPAILARENVMDIYVPKPEIAITTMIAYDPARAADLRDVMVAGSDHPIGYHITSLEVRGLIPGTRVAIIDSDTKAILTNATVKGRVWKSDYASVDEGARNVEIMLSHKNYKDERVSTMMSGGDIKIVTNQAHKDAETYTPDIITQPDFGLLRKIDGSKF